MPSGDNNRKITAAQALEALRQHGGNVNAAARALGVKGPTIRRYRKQAEARGEPVPLPPWTPSRGQKKQDSHAQAERVLNAVTEGWIPPDAEKPLTGGRIDPRDIIKRPLPSDGRTARYICTGAVNNTDVHPALWANLTALSEHFRAEILVRRIAYNLNAYRQHADTELSGPDGAPAEVYYDAAVLPYICDERVELAPGLHWAGDAPVTATAVSPLSGYDTFTGDASAIFAATKIEMRSIATMRGQHAKLLYTTGVVTQRNYTETKTGQKADWHHSYAALLVEVDDDGDWFVWHLIADEDGTVNLPGLIVRNGSVRPAQNVAAATPGDIHARTLDEAVRKVMFGEGGLIDRVRPAELHAHDLHDHESRSHHDTRDPFRRFQLQRAGRDDVAAEIEADAAFLREASRPWMRIVVVGSNHDDHLRRWLCEADWRADPVNARFYLQAADRMLEATETGDRDFHLLEWACKRFGAPGDVVFLRPDQSWTVYGVECGLHGDQGPNGSRGSVRALSKIGAKVNVGHSHSAGIIDGAWQAGLTGGALDVTMDYARGPSSWSRTMILTYVGGKRSMLTMRGLKFPPLLRAA